MEVFEDGEGRRRLRVSAGRGVPSNTKQLNVMRLDTVTTTEVHRNLMNTRKVEENEVVGKGTLGVWAYLARGMAQLNSQS